VARNATVSLSVAVPDTVLVYRNGVRVALADLVARDRIRVAGLKKTEGSVLRPASRVLA
jgi:hypothetical protein